MTAAHPRPPVVVSLIVNAGSEEGHPIPYNQAVGDAARQLGWDHLAAYPATCHLSQVPPGWQPALHRITYSTGGGSLLGQRSGLPQWGSVWRAAQSIRAYLRANVLPREQPVILFIEFFIFAHLLALVLALLGLPQQRLSVWLLYRLDIHKQPTRRLYRVLNDLIAWLVRGRLTLLTDSALLARPLHALFARPVQIVPIPHTQLSGPAHRPGHPTGPTGEPLLLAWWPGAVRGDKGIDQLRALARQAAPAAQRVCLAATEAAQLAAVPGGCQVRLLPGGMPRADYLGWLQAADLILLPYDASSYAERTSGIFVEAIAAGKAAPVTPGTWMAHEAIANGLPELVIDWRAGNVWDNLVRLAEDTSVQSRLAAMASRYQAYHSVNSFSAWMAQQWQAEA